MDCLETHSILKFRIGKVGSPSIHTKAEMAIAFKTCMFNFEDALALFQKSFMLRHVAMQSSNLFITLALLSNESVSNLPRYVADFFLGTSWPCPRPVGEKWRCTEDWL